MPSAIPHDRITTLSTGEAARRLGVAAATLRGWRVDGQGPRFVKVGGLVRYRVTDLSDWLDERTRTSTSDPGPSKVG